MEIVEQTRQKIAVDNSIRAINETDQFLATHQHLLKNHEKKNVSFCKIIVKLL
jgi:hypothetical protein